MLEIGERTLAAVEQKQVSLKLETLFRGLTPFSIYRVLGTSGVLRTMETNGYLDGFGRAASAKAAKESLSQRDVLKASYYERAMGGDTRCGELWLRMEEEDRGQQTFGDVQIIITPYTVPDEYVVKLEGADQRDGSKMRASLVKTT